MNTSPLSEIAEEIRKALDAALPGTWERTGEGWFNVPNCAKIVVKDDWGQTYIASVFAGNHQEANAHLIANAPTWLRTLLEENERLQSIQQERDKLIAVVRHYASDRTFDGVWCDIDLTQEARWILEEIGVREERT